jgi:hypothetical protein
MHELIAELRADGHEVLLADDGTVVVSWSWERPADPELVRRLRAHEQEAHDYLVAERAAREALYVVATAHDSPFPPLVRLREDGTMEVLPDPPDGGHAA